MHILNTNYNLGMDGLTLGLFIFIFLILFSIVIFLFVERNKIFSLINTYSVSTGSGTNSSFAPGSNEIFIAAKGTTEILLSNVNNAKGYLFFISNVHNDGEVTVKPPSGVSLNSDRIDEGKGAIYVWSSNTSIDRIV
jgi:hypothetical protein